MIKLQLLFSKSAEQVHVLHGIHLPLPLKNAYGATHLYTLGLSAERSEGSVSLGVKRTKKGWRPSCGYST